MERLDKVEEKLYSVANEVAVMRLQIQTLREDLTQGRADVKELSKRTETLEDILKEARGAWRVAIPLASAIGSIVSVVASHFLK